MDRLGSMLDRLPPIYTIDPGTLIHQLLGLVAGAMATFDEDMDRVQRSHWIDEAFDREDLEKLGALVGVPGAPWEPDALYRTRLKVTVTERLRGSVTRAELQSVLTRLLEAAQQSMGVRYMQILPDTPGAPPVFRSEPSEWMSTPVFVEFPPARRRSSDLVGRGGILRPLDKFVAKNRGKDPTVLEGVLRGVAQGRTAMPLLVNLTNGTAMGYAGVVRAGQELAFFAGKDGDLRAVLNDADVTSHLYTTDSFVPGVPFTPVIPDPNPRPIQLARGENTLWFLSIALYDQPGLDNALLAMASPDMAEGLFADHADHEGTNFDFAVFYQPPAGVLDAWWTERVPASFRFEVPAGAVQRRSGRRPQPEEDHMRLFAMLQATVDLLRAGGVVGEVRARPLGVTQR